MQIKKKKKIKIQRIPSPRMHRNLGLIPGSQKVS
jgi:hypothetical protein